MTDLLARAGFFVFLAVFAPASALAGAEKTEWTKFDNSVPGLADSGAMNGRLPLGTTGKGDDGYNYPGNVIKDVATYKMWYGGYGGGKYRIYLATCDQPPEEGTIFYSW